MPEAQITPDRRGRRTLWFLSIAALLVVAVFVAPAAVRAWVSSEIEANVDQPLPAFRVADRSGVEWSPDALRGKVAVLHFFRSRCGSCSVQAPQIRELQAAADPEQVVFLGVMTDALQSFYSEDEAQETLARYGFRHPVLMADAAFADAFHGTMWSHVTPVTYVADGTGRIRFAFRGLEGADELGPAIESLRPDR